MSDETLDPQTQALRAEQIRTACARLGLSQGQTQDAIRWGTQHDDALERYDPAYDGTPLSWLERRRADHPHWFTPQGTAELQGTPRYRAGLSPRERAALIEEIGGDAYNRLPLNPPADHPAHQSQGVRRRSTMSAQEKSAVIAAQGIDALLRIPW
jgi:hypothetical protein